jgi:uncharacterized protein YcbX
VKSMQGERLERAELTAHGLVGDRGYALVDTETGKVVSAKSVRLFPDVLRFRATFVEPSSIQITLPDGSTVTNGSDNADRVLSGSFGRAVTLAEAAPKDFVIDQYYPDIQNLDPVGYRDTVREQKLGAAFFAQAGLVSPVPVNSFFDLFPISVITTSTLEYLSALRPQSCFDQRRFRMNLIVETKEQGFVENHWVGRQLNIGDAVRLRVMMPDPRCVMTILGQDELPKDNEILKTIAQHNLIQVGSAGLYPCAGIYAVVEASGTLRIGDRVVLN